MQVHTGNGTFREEDKQFGLDLEPQHVLGALRTFFKRPRHQSGKKMDVVVKCSHSFAARRLTFFIGRLEELLHWFKGKIRKSWWILYLSTDLSQCHLLSFLLSIGNHHLSPTPFTFLVFKPFVCRLRCKSASWVSLNFLLALSVKDCASYLKRCPSFLLHVHRT